MYTPLFGSCLVMSLPIFPLQLKMLVKEAQFSGGMKVCRIFFLAYLHIFGKRKQFRIVEMRRKKTENFSAKLLYNNKFSPACPSVCHV